MSLLLDTAARARIAYCLSHYEVPPRSHESELFMGKEFIPEAVVYTDEVFGTTYSTHKVRLIPFDGGKAALPKAKALDATANSLPVMRMHFYTYLYERDMVGKVMTPQELGQFLFEFVYMSHHVTAEQRRDLLPQLVFSEFGGNDEIATIAMAFYVIHSIRYYTKGISPVQIKAIVDAAYADRTFCRDVNYFAGDPPKYREYASGDKRDAGVKFSLYIQVVLGERFFAVFNTAYRHNSIVEKFSKFLINKSVYGKPMTVESLGKLLAIFFHKKCTSREREKHMAVFFGVFGALGAPNFVETLLTYYFEKRHLP